jgi:hypothetical protein
VIGTLNDGDRVYLVRNVEGWYEIRYDGNKTGWLRSDLVGPKNLSRTALAKTFVDSVLPAFNSEMYFDKQELYRVVYLILPEQDYSSKARAAQKARELGEAYQEKVYPGDLEIRIMKPDAPDELFMNVQLEAVSIADIPVPILEHGILQRLDSPEKGELRLWISVPDSLDEATSLALARSVSAAYAYPFTKAEIFLVENSPDTRAALDDSLQFPDPQIPILLYYLEDKNGEYYQFGVSGGIPSPYQ